ncbi:hypothetical protein [Planctomycetes bacterium K23_9]|uniref:Uncharacterized protein n=1 Tax=Stieleria marina TaxID=1930275 RepID=A0A517NUW7_9BACT|nr:hypothetical protein K239x_28950 [Planctomycetes bacterium K23_9]
MSHTALEPPESGPDFVAGFRLIGGSVLVLIGVVLALYIVTVVMGLIAADRPLELIDKIVVPAAERAIEHAEAKGDNAKNIHDVSDDLKRMIVLGIIAFLMLIPTIIATNLIHSGVNLMQGDAAKSLKQIAAKINALNH